MKVSLWLPVFLFFFVCLMLPATCSASFDLRNEPQIIPQPREMEKRSEPFHLLATTRIVVLSADLEDRFAGQMLAQEIKDVAGLQMQTATANLHVSSPLILIGRLTDPAVKDILQSRQLTNEFIGDQGYILDITPQEILLAGKDGSGVFYGIQTLKQLIVTTAEGSKVLGVRIRDWPALTYRGTEVDLSRGPVLKLEQLKRIVRTIAEFKMNLLTVYLEDVFPLEGDPLVGLLDDKLSRDDYKSLVSYAADYHVEIVPITGGCGHLHKVLRFERYAELGEIPLGNDLSFEGEAGTFLERLYSQMQPIFPAPIYHVGCDTPNELGTGRSASFVQSDGYAKVYLENLLRAYTLVHRYGKQVIFWSDAVVAHPELIGSLPKDMIPASMRVWPEPSYEKSIKPFADAGLRFFVCPWVGNAHVIVPDYEAAAANIGVFVEEGKRLGGIGMIVAVWNDDGEIFNPNWWSIVFAAANAWEVGRPDVGTFDDKFDWAFYRNTDHTIVRAIKSLGHLNEMIREHGISFLYTPNFGGTNNLLFWEDPFGEEAKPDIGSLLPIAPELRRAAEDAYVGLVIAGKKIPRNADTLKSLEFAALKLDALGLRYEGVADLSSRYAKVLALAKSDPSAVDGELYRIQGVNGILFDLRDYNSKLRELYRTLWLDENLPAWLPNMLAPYDRASDMWQREITKWERIKRDYRRGIALPSAESLGLLPEKPAELRNETPRNSCRSTPLQWKESLDD